MSNILERLNNGLIALTEKVTDLGRNQSKALNDNVNGAKILDKDKNDKEDPILPFAFDNNYDEDEKELKTDD